MNLPKTTFYQVETFFCLYQDEKRSHARIWLSRVARLSVPNPRLRCFYPQLFENLYLSDAVLQFLLRFEVDFLKAARFADP